AARRRRDRARDLSGAVGQRCARAGRGERSGACRWVRAGRARKRDLRRTRRSDDAVRRDRRGRVTVAEISAEQVRRLRERTGAGMMECKRALQEADGDMARAEEILRERGLKDVQKRAGRSAAQGLVDSYIHFNNTVGVLVEVNCETDFVAATEEFKALTKDVALHVASAAPRWLTREEIPTAVLDAERRVYEAQAREQGKPDNVIERMVEGKLDAFYRDNVLLDQKFVKDDSKSMRSLVDEVSAKVGEKVAVRRFVRYKLGEELD